MAKVNTKFIIILTGVIVVAVLGAVVAMQLVLKKPADHIRAGDKFMEEKKYAAAASSYSRAVNKDQSNVAYLIKWRDAMQQVKVEDTTRGMEAMEKLRICMRQIAFAQATDLPSQHAYLRFLTERARVLGGNSEELMRQLAAEAEVFLQFYTKPEGGWKTLERYRAMSIGDVVTRSENPRQEDIDRVVQSSLDAMQADPADPMPVLAYARLNLYLLNRAIAAEKPEDASLFEAKVKDSVDAFLELNPQEPSVQIFRIEKLVGDALRDLARLTDRESKVKLSQERTQQLRTGLDKVAGDILAMDPGVIDEDLVERFRALEEALFPQDRFKLTLQIFSKLEEAQPENAFVLVRHAMTLSEVQDLDRAVELVRKVQSIPPQNISPAAVRLFDMRISATMFESIWNVKRASAMMEKEREKDREQIISEARSALATLKTLRDAESPQVLLAEAHVAFIERRPRDASQFLDRYTDKSNGGDADSHLLRYLVEAQRGNYGEARNALVENLKRNPRNPAAMIRVAEVDLQLKEYESALALSNQVLEIYPQYAEAQGVRDRALFFLNRSTSSDPIVQAIRDLEKFANDNVADPLIDKKVLERATQLSRANPQSVPIMRVLGIAQARTGDKAAAAATFRRSLEIEDDPGTRMLLADVEAKDVLEAQLARINSDPNADELTKALSASAAYRQAGRPQEAKAQAEQAAKLAPDDPRVIESLFVVATDGKDWAEAERLVQKAASGNIDSANGQTYRGQLLVARGEFRQAVEILNQVVARGGAGPEVYRMLGRAHLGGQNPAEATKAFTRAVEIRPNDAAAIRELVFSLSTQGRREEALQFARANEKFAGGDPAFLRQLLALEGSVGDKQIAVARRERLATSQPQDRDNLMELANLYVQEKRWTEAKAAIDRARQIRMDADIAMMEATWLWDQEKRPEALKVFEDLEAGKQGAEAMRAKLVHAQFLLQRGEEEEGTKVLESARPLQDLKSLEVDRVLAEVLFRRQEFARAAEASKALIAAGVEVSGQRKRLASCYIGLGQFKEAQAELDGLMKAGEEDLEGLILKATVQEGLGKVDATREYLDQAVARFPSEPGAFRSRGLFLLTQPQSAKDAKADFDSALKLRENDAELLEFRARAHVQLKQMDLALSDYRAALRQNPRNDQLLFGLLADLFRPAFNRPDDAMMLAQEVISQRPKETALVVSIGDMFLQAKRSREAAAFYRDALKAQKDLQVTQKLLDALLSQTPPQIQDAEGVLGSVQTEVRNNPGFLMAFAKIRMFQGRLQESDRYSLEAVKLLDPTQPSRMFAWYNDVQRVQPDQAKVAEFLEKLSKLDVTPAAAQWLLFLRSDILTQMPDRREEAHANFRELMDKAVIGVIGQYSHRVLGGSLYAIKNYEEAAAVWESLLVKFPEDYESMNNLAYTYIKFLNKPAEADKWASKAAAAMKNSAEVQDTYGFVLIDRDCTKAIGVLERALLLVNQPRTEVTVCIHLAQALLKCDKKEAAKEAVQRADRVMTGYAESGEVDDETRAELEQIRILIGS